jgi:hypothetical protein
MVTLDVAYPAIVYDALIFANLVDGLYFDRPVPNLCKVFEALVKTPSTSAFAQVT